MAEELHGRALMESRYGLLGCGEPRLSLGGAVLAVDELLARLGLKFDDTRAIDAQRLREGNYVVRYLDAQDQRVVAVEFDEELRIGREVRAHYAEWVGDEAFFSFYGGH
jgi:hypothetical protein